MTPQFCNDKVAQFLIHQEIKRKEENWSKDESLIFKKTMKLTNSLDRISEEKESMSVITDTKTVQNKNGNIQPEIPINFIDMDEDESDEMYIHNVFNYSKNRFNFWNNAIITNLSLVNPDNKLANAENRVCGFKMNEPIFACIKIPKVDLNSQKLDFSPVYFEAFDTVESWQVYQVKSCPKMLKLCRGVINHADQELYVEIIPMHINWGEIVQIMLEVDDGISENLKIIKNRQKMKMEYVKYLADNHDLIQYTQADFQLK